MILSESHTARLRFSTVSGVICKFIIVSLARLQPHPSRPQASGRKNWKLCRKSCEPNLSTRWSAWIQVVSLELLRACRSEIRHSGRCSRIGRAGWPIPRSSTLSTAFKRHQLGKGHECVQGGTFMAGFGCEGKMCAPEAPPPNCLRRAFVRPPQPTRSSASIVAVSFESFRCVRERMHPSDRRLLGGWIALLIQNPRCN